MNSIDFLAMFADDELVKAFKANPKVDEVLAKHNVTREEADELISNIDRPFSQEQMQLLRELAEAPDNRDRRYMDGYCFTRCESCGSFYRRRYVQIKGDNGELHDKALRCPTCHPEDGVAEVADLAKAQTAEIKASMPDLLKACGVKAKSRGCRFDNFSVREGSVDAFQAAKDFVTNKDTVLLLIGPTGVGKTHLAVACMEKFLMSQKDCYLAKEARLGRDISDSRCFRAKETINDMHKRYCSYPLLVIDELGQGTWTNGESTEILDIIDDRIEDEDKKTILISNMDWRTFSERFGDRIVSRLDGYGQIMRLVDGDNRRRQQ